jgi:hypothetical protein
MQEALEELAFHFRDVGLVASSYALERIAESIARKIDISILATDIRFFNETVAREMQDNPLFIIHPAFVKYNASPEALFSEKILKEFPVIRDEVEDAARCIAFGRGTSSVFHLMRIMEAGLKILAKSLGIPYAPSWEAYLKQIGSKIDAPHKTKGIRWKRDEPFFRDILGDLHNVKIAWRNPTMHIVRRYTPDEADEVFRAVRTFMGRIATRK